MKKVDGKTRHPVFSVGGNGHLGRLKQVDWRTREQPSFFLATEEAPARARKVQPAVLEEIMKVVGDKTVPTVIFSGVSDGVALLRRKTHGYHDIESIARYCLRR